ALFAQRRENGRKLALGRRRHDVGRGRPVAAHAHVERTVEAEGKSARRLVELHRGDPEVEDDAVDRVVAAAARDRLQIGEFVLHQSERAGGGAHETGAACDRAWVAVDANDVAVRGREDIASVAAGTEGRVDVDAAGADGEEFDRGAAEHGNVTSQSASDSASAVAARHHSRAPGGPSAPTRAPSCFVSARTFSVAYASSARKRPGSQI